MRAAFVEMELVSTNSHETGKRFSHAPFQPFGQQSITATVTVLSPSNHRATRNYERLTVVFYRLNGPDHSKSDLQDTSPDGKRHSVGSIIGAELSDQILDVKVHGCLRDRKAIGNLLVAVSVSNELKYLQFAIRE